MTEDKNYGKWERRWHPLREEWVVYAAHRNSRPWSFDINTLKKDPGPEYDPGCYLCPGNSRVHGSANPEYKGVYIFDNDHPVVGLHAPEIKEEHKLSGKGLYRREKAAGVARVVCYDPRHNVTLAEVDTQRVAEVFYAWKTQMQEFISRPEITNVLIFENKGEAVGVSNPHPHCQIYATDFLFKFTEQHLRVAEKYSTETGANIFADIIFNEKESGERIVAENKGAVAFIPFFARYAYEIMIFPKNRHATLATMSEEELYDLAAIFQEVTRRFDINAGMSFPYVMSVIQAPVDGNEYPEHHLYLWLQPPYRQPGLLKFLAGPELGIGNFMADTVPEEKAGELRKADISQYLG